jgi:signal transduction histidine kinase
MVPESFYLDEVVTESVRAAKVLGTERHVTVALSNSVPDALCQGDEGLLRQLLLILLDNAVKFTPAGGHVVVSLVQAGSAYDIFVADTGLGIAPANQQLIFDRFYRVDNSRSRVPGTRGGAGLGLAIAKWVAEIHQGSLRLEKSDQHGSTFHVQIPCPAADLVAGDPMRLQVART